MSRTLDGYHPQILTARTDDPRALVEDVVARAFRNPFDRSEWDELREELAHREAEVERLGLTLAKERADVEWIERPLVRVALCRTASCQRAADLLGIDQRRKEPDPQLMERIGRQLAAVGATELAAWASAGVDRNRLRVRLEEVPPPERLALQLKRLAKHALFDHS